MLKIIESEQTKKPRLKRLQVLKAAKGMTNRSLSTACWLPVNCLPTAWRLPDDFLMTAWQLPETARRLPDDCLMTAWRLPCDCLTTLWLLPDNCLRTTWHMSDNYLTTAWLSTAWHICLTIWRQHTILYNGLYGSPRQKTNKENYINITKYILSGLYYKKLTFRCSGLDFLDHTVRLIEIFWKSSSHDV